MKTGQCPKCKSHDIYCSLDGGGIGEEFSLHVSIEDAMIPTEEWQTFLCTACGYFENYLLDKVEIAHIVENPQKAGWKKIS